MPPKPLLLSGHAWEVSHVDFHPAGNMLVSASWDKSLRIWDADDGSELRSIPNAHASPVTCASWHPNGALIASTSADNTTCLWDASTGTRMRTLREHFGWVLHCSFAPDRTKLATASWDKTVRLWDPNTGELISTLRGHTKGVWACAFYPVGHTSALLASAGEDCTARLWDTRTRRVALTLGGGHADAIYSCAWASDGSMLATGSADKTVTLWDPKAGKIFRMLKAHTDTVKSVCFMPSGDEDHPQLLASAGGFSSILWHPKSSANNLIAEHSAHDPGKEVESVSLSYNGGLLASSGRDGKIYIHKTPEHAIRSSRKNESLSYMSPGDVKAALPKQRKQILAPAGRDESDKWTGRATMIGQDDETTKADVGPTEQPVVNKPTRTDVKKLLEQRGWGSNGIGSGGKETEEDAGAEEDTAEPEVLHGFGAEPEPEAPATLRPTRKDIMLDDHGGAHPMVAMAREQYTGLDAGEPAEGEEPALIAADRKFIEDPSQVMQARRGLADKHAVELTEEQAEAYRRRPANKAPELNDAQRMSQLLTGLEPVLRKKPRLRNSTLITATMEDPDNGDKTTSF